MNATATWIVESKHLDPNDFYVKVDGSDFYTAYWVANASNDQQAISLALEASEELDLGETEIQEAIEYSGQQISNTAEVDAAIGKYTISEDIQLAAWISYQGGKW